MTFRRGVRVPAALPSRKLVVASCLTVCCAAVLLGQAPLNLQDTLPFDSVVKTAALPNGLKY